MMIRFPSLHGLLLAATASAVLLPHAVAAQADIEPGTVARTQFGIGYVANAPDAMAGASLYVISPRWGGIGVYVDGKFDISDPTSERGWVEDLTAEELENDVGGDFVKTESSWWSLNVALMRPLSRDFTVYAGGGLATQSVYGLYNVGLDSDIGLGGVAWVQDTRAETAELNLMIGGITRLTRRVGAHFGYETKPSGITAGVSIRLPGW